MDRKGEAELSSPTISRHEVQVFKALLATREWISVAELAKLAEVAPRTARAHATKLTDRGLVERAEVFPGYRYRITRNAVRSTYDAELRSAADAMGVALQDAP